MCNPYGGEERRLYT
jgi:hypothetical protein